jgi:sigma-B regulation protein RsbU (phosphoserine phosphatase)
MIENKSNYRTALLGMLIILLTILGAYLLYYSGVIAYKEIFKLKIQTENFRSRMAAEVKRMNAVINSAQRTPQDLATIFEFHNTSEPEIEILLKSVIFNNAELYGGSVVFEPYKYHPDSLYFSSYIYRQGDAVTLTNLNGPEYEYFYKDWYLVPKTLNKPAWSEPYYDGGGGDVLMSTYSVPFYKYTGNNEQFYGIVTIDVSIQWLTSAVSSIGRILNARAFLLSENGTVLSAPNQEWIYNETIFSLAEEKKLPILRTIGRELQQGKSGIKCIETEEDQRWLLFYEMIPASKWGLLMLISEAELLKKGSNSKILL